LTTLVDPKNITNYNRTDSELETFWLFCLFVAGKNSDTASIKLSQFLSDMTPWDTPFSYLKEIDIHNKLLSTKSGQYTRLSIAIKQSIDLDLRNCDLNDLLCIYGVGPKTARFFLLHTRENLEYAVLDTHILKWVRNHSGYEDAPKDTPQNQQDYDKWSSIAISLMKDSYPDLSFADIDLLIWTEISGRLEDE
jgi:thermostable 8-oxoguanine DNA glycosylase